MNDSYKIAERLVSLLKMGDASIATVESLTGGSLASSIIDISGASEVFNEGYVTYSNEAKERIVGVGHNTLESYGAVSEETAITCIRLCRHIKRCWLITTAFCFDSRRTLARLTTG